MSEGEGAGGTGTEPGALEPLDAILVAAGESRRMGGIEKLSAPLGGRPLLRWSLEALAAVPEVRRIVVVTAPGRVADVSAAPWLPARVVAVVAGGLRRHESVAAGVAELGRLDREAGQDLAERVVLVHDGARPMATSALVRRVAAAAQRHGAAIPVLPISETLKQVGPDGRVEATLDREPLAAAQTPQGCRRELLEGAYARFPPSGPATWTDEAALLEACRIPVHAIPGEPANLKVTLPDDLRRAEALVSGRAPSTGMEPAAYPGDRRVGIGSDRHSFGPGEPLALGGLIFEGMPRLHGHSDGDVVLHAVADALLGAAGLGDLGRLFPADDRTPRGIAGRALVAEALRRVEERGLRSASIDLVIVGARPRLAERLDEMALALAELVGLAPDRVNVKASTGNLAGPEGEGRGLAAEVVVLLKPVDTAPARSRSPAEARR